MTQSPIANRLIATLPEADQEIFANWPSVTLELRQVLYRDGDPLQHVYFIQQGVASIIVTMEGGDAIEVGMIGNEGLVGVSALLGRNTSPHQALVQIEGTALQIPAEQCRALFAKSAAFRIAALLFVDSFLTLTSQTAACNRLHAVEQRCARWLLMATDRTQSDTVHFTHEFLSVMLGVRRAGVTETAGDLQRSGLISYHRGELKIVDRKGLEAAACECYRIERRRYSWIGTCK